MKITNLKKLKPKKLIVFDLDGTLVPSKSIMDREMSQLLTKLLSKSKVAVIGGGNYAHFTHQLLDQFKAPKYLYGNLFLFPTTSTVFYLFKNSWKKIYSHGLSRKQVKQIFTAFERVFKEMHYQHPKKTYGNIIEDRGTQVTFSVYGQDIATVLGKKGIKMKQDWREKNNSLKLKMAKRVAKYLPDLEVRAAGVTSIDVTKKGIDKAYGLTQIQKYLGVKIKDMVFIGDAIFPGGNDYAVVRMGVDYIPIKGPSETKKIIRHLLG